jgi:hypothetical protein
MYKKRLIILLGTDIDRSCMWLRGGLDLHETNGHMQVQPMQVSHAKLIQASALVM